MNTPSGSGKYKSMVTLENRPPPSIPKRQPKRQNFKDAAVARSVHTLNNEQKTRYLLPVKDKIIYTQYIKSNLAPRRKSWICPCTLK